MTSRNAAARRADAISLTECATDFEIDGEKRVRVFASLWALAAFAHVFKYLDETPDSPTMWILAWAALWLARSPTSRPAFVVFALSQIADTVAQAPGWDNDQALMCAVNVVVLLHLTLGRDRSVAGIALRQGSSIRWLTLGAYTAAALAKYNTAFFDPLQSCAVIISDAATKGVIGMNHAFGEIHVLLAVGPETLIPLLLLIPATRPLGARLGIAFHFLVTASPFIRAEDFTLTLIALFSLFLTQADIDRTLGEARRLSAQSFTFRAAARIPSGPLGALSSLGILAVATLTVGSGGIVWPLGLAVGGFMLFVLFRKFRFSGAGAPRLDRPTAIGSLALAAILLLGASPYLGLRTWGTFTMFSNLHFEGSSTNHFFMPSWPLYDDGNDVVRVSDGSTRFFERFVGSDDGITRFRASRILQLDPEAILVGTVAGSPVNTAETLDGFEAPSWIETKTRSFREVSTGETIACRA